MCLALTKEAKADWELIEEGEIDHILVLWDAEATYGSYVSVPVDLGKSDFTSAVFGEEILSESGVALVSELSGDDFSSECYCSVCIALEIMGHYWFVEEAQV